MRKGTHMKTAGIIVEYNPFHNGHIHHIQETRKLTDCDVLIACMSGNFVQRGEPAIIDKWQRARWAIENGVDLVIELPFAFTVQSASQFGENAIKLLHLAGAQTVVFGSETNNMEELEEIASMSFNVDNFRENLKLGYSYPASYGYMADSYGPNDILAISYLKALANYPDMNAISIQRTSGYHDTDMSVEYPSGMAIRTAIKNGTDISESTPYYKELSGYPFPTLKDFYPYIRMLLVTMSPEELREIFLMSEGIENHLAKQAAECETYEEFINRATTKRYTTSRIQRTLCHLLVHNTKTFMSKLPPLDRLRVLAFNNTGRDYIRKLQEQDGVTIVNHFTQQIKPYRDLELKAAYVYAMLMDEKHRYSVVRGEVCGQYLK